MPVGGSVETLWREVPHMLISGLSASSATRWGAALPGARASLLSPEPQWMFEPVGATGGLGVTCALSGTGSAGVVDVAGVATATTAAPVTKVMARRPKAINGLPSDNRKQQYVHTTRVNVDGGGAPGPEPEREQALPKGRLDPLQAADPQPGPRPSYFAAPVLPHWTRQDQQSERGWHRCSGPTPP